MERHREAMEKLLKQSVVVAGHTDLARGERKFSGNAQRRRRAWLLFHGTILLRFNFARIEQLLKLPPLQPAYRRQRRHDDFLIGLPVGAAEVKAALQEAWAAKGEFSAVPWAEIGRLVAERYGREEWNLRC
jgi:lipoate-protein ligase A